MSRLTILKVTLFFEWIEERLDKGVWFRRGYLGLATALMWKSTLWCSAYAMAALGKQPGLDTAAVVTAVSGVPGAVLAHAFMLYNQSRS